MDSSKSPLDRRRGAYIYGQKLSLDEWISLLKKHKNVVPRNCFPTEAMRDEYLSSIADRTESEVRFLLYHFLPHPGTTRGDLMAFDAMTADASQHQNLSQAARRRLERVCESQYFLRMLRGQPAWEGITWILDLLSESPKQCLDVINAYHDAHIQPLSDNAAHGLMDAALLVRAKFIHYEHPSEVLHDLGSRRFEKLVAELYATLGYSAPPLRNGPSPDQPVVSRTGLTACERRPETAKHDQTGGWYALLLPKSDSAVSFGRNSGLTEDVA